MESLMWSYDALLGKAGAYFNRAENHPKADSEVFALWLLLGLEFLLRAPLARVHPTLLAEPDSVLHAAGFPSKSNQSGTKATKDPKSVATHTVITRLGAVIDDFTKERQDEATFLTNLRNRELHTGDAALSLDSAVWLPRFTRVTKVVCQHLELEPSDLLGQEIVQLGQQLVDDENQRLDYEVRKRIEECAAAFASLTPEVVAARRAAVRHGDTAVLECAVECPACHSEVWPSLEAVRRTNERIEPYGISVDVISVATELSCGVCGLQLSGTAEFKSAGLPQQYTHEEEETFEQRFLDTYEPDYGND
ncbi:hypothetical protein ACIPD2_21495 [Streptomyces griseofuscus]|uniref:hypothetical protein n=1 Tax=Streptomyces griseofuscus TaxID=146922 RepID=UPI0037FA78D0